MTNAKQLLSRSSLFQGASDAIIQEFLGLAEPVQFAAGEIPVAEATVDDRISMVVEGELKISVELQAPDQDLKFFHAAPGTFLGLVNFFSAASQPCTATALGEVKMLAWKAEDWRRIAEANPAFGYQLSQRIGHELVERMSNWINDLLNSVSWGV
jgi:CRP-like cAMP-binding protein